MARFAQPVPVLPLARLAEAADIVVECAPAALLREIAEPALKAGRTLIVLCAAARSSTISIWSIWRAVTAAASCVPTGALLGLDAVQAAAQGDHRTRSR